MIKVGDVKKHVSENVSASEWKKARELFFKNADNNNKVYAAICMVDRQKARDAHIWCLENVDTKKMDVISKSVFAFTDNNDALRFKLTWC